MITSGHWNSSSPPIRTSNGLGEPLPSLLTPIFVSSDNRTERLMSALG
jgi:hypothetical protein